MEKGVLRDGDLDESITAELAGLAADHSMEAMMKFAGPASGGKVGNKAGFLIGIIRRMQIEYGLPKGGGGFKGGGRKGWEGGKGWEQSKGGRGGGDGGYNDGGGYTGGGYDQPPMSRAGPGPGPGLRQPPMSRASPGPGPGLRHGGGGDTTGLFQRSLAEQVKNMLKLYYQRKEVNKDQFKLIVKKTTEKLFAAHAPEAVDHPAAVADFMTAARVDKIQKLVDGYVRCYGNVS